MAPLQHDEYQIGIICALSIEQAAVKAMLDEDHGIIEEKDNQDHNVYFAGRIHKHNVVIACLPSGVDGLVAAATGAKDMSRTFRQLRFGLLVGIGGGLPNPSKGVDIRLGDVVVSQPEGVFNGVVQYDKGKAQKDGQWVRKGALNAPPVTLLTALRALQTMHESEESEMASYLTDMLSKKPKMKKTGYGYPGNEYDILYASNDQNGRHDNSAGAVEKIVSREARSSTEPFIYYGTIASGNTVVKDALERDSLLNEFGALCVEMEAAGLMNDFPCLVIRGICDYADEYKNDLWHRYAAATAAAFAKELLLYISVEGAKQEESVQQILGLLGDHFQQQRLHNEKQETYSREQQVHNKEHQSHMRRAEVNYTNEKHRECHQVFKTSSYENQKDVNPPPARNTCRWVLDHPRYSDWHENPMNKLLWISADPGCGKSVLSRFFVDTRLGESNGGTSTFDAFHTVCYFFFKDNETQDKLSIALCAVLHQFFDQQPSLIRHAIPVYERNGSSLPRETNELWRILIAATADSDAKPIACVLDALDECCDADRGILIYSLCEFYNSSLSGTKITALKWIVTSRPYDDIHGLFSRRILQLPSIHIPGENENDQIREEINIVIHDRMYELARDLNLTLQKTDELTEQLLAMQDRTYLWLYLAIDEIRSTFNASLEYDVEWSPSLPASVEDAYEKILARVTDRREQKHARNILLIIIGARRPLTVHEMALALGIASSTRWPQSLSRLRIRADLEKSIRRWCGLFVYINHDRLFLLHQTAKEFLLSHNEGMTVPTTGWRYCLQPIEIEREMARICTLFLCLSEFDRFDIRHGFSHRFHLLLGDQDAIVYKGDIQNFYVLAAQHWAAHAHEAERVLDPDTKYAMELLYDVKSCRFFNWTTPMWNGLDYRAQFFYFNALQLAAFNGHGEMVEQILKDKRKNVESGYGRRALFWAAERNFPDVVRILLRHGADVNAHGRWGTALTAASSGGYAEVVELLLDAGADINAQGIFGDTALVLASRHDHEQTVRMLLDAGAEIDIFGEFETALIAASGNSNQYIVKLLLDRGADPNTQGTYSTALIAASATHNPEITDMLISKGGDVNMLGVYETAPTTAVRRDASATVNLLLDKGADIDAQGEYGTALIVASAEGCRTNVQLLLDRGANVNVGGSTQYSSALVTASERGHGDVVQLLLDNGADINAQDVHDDTALVVTSKRGREQTIQLILHESINTKTPEVAHYSTALAAAAGRGHDDVVELLLDRGADVNAQGKFYETALIAAARNGHIRIVWMLLKAGADVGVQGNGYYESAMESAVRRGHKVIVKLLKRDDTAVIKPWQVMKMGRYGRR